MFTSLKKLKKLKKFRQTQLKMICFCFFQIQKKFQDKITTKFRDVEKMKNNTKKFENKKAKNQ